MAPAMHACTPQQVEGAEPDAAVAMLMLATQEAAESDPALGAASAEVTPCCCQR